MPCGDAVRVPGVALCAWAEQPGRSKPDSATGGGSQAGSSVQHEDGDGHAMDLGGTRWAWGHHSERAGEAAVRKGLMLGCYCSHAGCRPTLQTPTPCSANALTPAPPHVTTCHPAPLLAAGRVVRGGPPLQPHAPGVPRGFLQRGPRHHHVPAPPRLPTPARPGLPEVGRRPRLPQPGVSRERVLYHTAVYSVCMTGPILC